MGQSSVRLANVFCDGSSQPQVGRAEIHVECDQGSARADDDGAGCLVEVGRAKIRCPVRIGGHAEGEALKPSSADRFEWGMIAVQGRLFVEEDGDLQLCPDLLPQSPCQMDTVLHRCPAQWDKGHDICRPHPRMDTSMLSKIDEIGRHANRAKSSFSDGVRFTGKAQD